MNRPDEIRILSPTGVCGSGFLESSFEKALALSEGADVVAAGRASDTAIFPAVPLMRGFPEGLAWRAAKILECGAAAVVERRTPDWIFAWLRRDHFVVQALDESLQCKTPHAAQLGSDPIF